MKLGWLSDIHLNFLDDESRRSFLARLGKTQVDGWLLSGDIGEADCVADYLRELAEAVAVPVYFVLGNHDFYRGSLEQVRSRVADLSSQQDGLAWLTASSPIEAAPGLAVVGDDCWADGRLGDAVGTPRELNDFYLISELTGRTRASLIGELNRLGDEAATRLGPKLQDAARASGTVVVVCHPPPFEGATWHQGEISTPEWLPWFSCEAAGLLILDCASRHPDTSFHVLCGHTHSPGQYTPTGNVSVFTAGAEYGCPEVQSVLEFGQAAPRVA